MNIEAIEALGQAARDLEALRVETLNASGQEELPAPARMQFALAHQAIRNAQDQITLAKNNVGTALWRTGEWHG